MSVFLEPDFLVDHRGNITTGVLQVEAGRIAGTVERAPDGATRISLAGRMLMPAFVNAHSHAFQRALRGRVERRSEDQPLDDFWSWRDAMYADANRVTVDDVEVLATWCYLDGLRTGFAATAEFHYVHHHVDGARGAGAFSGAIARAAHAVGARVAILETAYARAGANRPAAPEQRRFVFDDVTAFLTHARDARAHDSDLVTHGFAIHSVRACPRSWIEAVASAAREDGVPLHAHACEQRAELRACLAEHGMKPLALLHASGALAATETSRTTIVHATHIEHDDVELLARARATVCVCPSTERNLGDGLCPIADLQQAGVPLAIGTDSHARIDVVDELRSLEDHERLRLERRGALLRPGERLAQALLAAGTHDGARALGLHSGTLDVGAPADLVAVRVPLEGRDDPAAGVDAWLVGGSGRDVSDVFVGGARVIEDGASTRVDARDIERRAREVLARLRTRSPSA
jgi:formimidoylglutamate deiminase